ncbi:MAG: permease-like cell division protein FtsX [Patescibacteria group bacterium]|jgi:cell division transport system permease protein
MFFLSFLRIVKFGLQDISRNIWLSVVTVIILILALFSINMLLVVKVVGEAAIGAVKSKIDVSLYVKPEAPEKEILALKAELSNISSVKSVRYISQEEALEIFKKTKSNNPEVLTALRELDKNPLSPTLVITPKSSDNMEILTHELNKIESSIIDSRDFSNYKIMLDRINAVTDRVTQAGLILAGILIFITLMVIFNSVRVAIYTHNAEISIMRLVGASNSFIYMPFLLSGLVYSFVGVMAIVLFFYPFLSLLQPYLEAFFVGYNVNIVNYFNEHFFIIFGLEFLGIALVNILASYFAARKYAQV